MDKLQQLHYTPQSCIWYCVLLNICATQMQLYATILQLLGIHVAQMLVNEWNENMIFHSFVDI
jgi:hypothetical protein